MSNDEDRLDKRLREIAEDGGQGESKTVTNVDAPSLRLLRCVKCKTLEELPDFKGPPKYDFVLDDLVAKHERAHPHDQITLLLLRVSEEDWNNRSLKRQIHSRIWEDVKGFKPEYYDTKNTYIEDAQKCFTVHGHGHKTSPVCVDYKDDDKRLGNPTSEGWKDSTPGNKIYLCDFCPIKSIIQRKAYEEQGLYQ